MHSFVVVICSYNNRPFVEANLESVFRQRHPRYRVLYYDDVSTDGTAEFAEEHVRRRRMRGRFTLVRNKEKHYSSGNLYRAGHACDDDEIIVVLDGDDMLAHDGVLTRLDEVYRNPEVWLTHGQHRWHPDGYPGLATACPEEVLRKNAFRQDIWRLSHLRSYYAWLSKRIQPSELYFQGGLLPMAGDQATMLPMAEMAGHRIQFIPEVLYIYNRHGLNADLVDKPLQRECAQFVRSLPAYERLDAKPPPMARRPADAPLRGEPSCP